MFRSMRSWKIAGTVLMLSLPCLATGCRTSTSGWGWTPSWPSGSGLSSLNPWKSSTSNSLASSKPSNQVPTPPAAMLAGNGMARNAQGTPAGSYGGQNPAPYGSGTSGATPNGAYAANGSPAANRAAPGTDYGARQVSATQNEGGYYTGPYSTGGGSGGAAPGGAATQNGPYSRPATGPAAVTADRRADSSYGSGFSSPAYGAPNNTSPSPGYNAPPAAPSYPSGASSSPYTGAATQSPYVGAVGQSGTGASLPSRSMAGGAEGYRPGSTGRASASVQPASFDAGASPTGSYDSSYPSTGAGDDSAYR